MSAPKRAKIYRPNKSTSGRAFNGRKNIDALYDAIWDKYRRRFLAINSRCYACGEPATVVDHLVPHKGDEKLFKKCDNHIPLCKLHHDQATGYFDRNYRPGSPIRNKLEWLAWTRARHELSFKVKVLPFYQEFAAV